MSDLREKYELLSVGHTLIPPKAKDTTELFYAALTILDSKASALMTFDSILIAAAAFTIEKGGGFVAIVLTLFGIVMALVAAALCLLVARISYPFLDKVTITSAAAGNPAQLDYSNELSALDEAVGTRTRYYRVAWRLSVAALFPFLIVFAMALFTSS